MENLNTTTILQTLFTSLFMGFGFLIPILSLIKISNLKGIHFKELFTLQAVQAVRVSGFFILLLQLPLFYNLWSIQQNQPSGMAVSVQGGNLENYGWVIFYGPVLYFVLTQLLWIKKMYMNKKLLIAFSLVLLILPSQFVLNFWVAQMHTHYVTANKAAEAGAFGIQLLLSTVVFFFTTFMLMQFTGKMKKVLK